MESFFRQSVMKGRARLLRALVIACSVLFCVSWHSACALQNGDDVRQRELLKMVSDAEQSLAERQWLQAVEQFDAAWAMACEREDPLLTASGADVNQLKPGETQQLAGGRARLEDLFLTAPDAFTAEYRTQFENLAESRISEAVTAGDFQTLRRLTLRYAFCPAAQNGLRILTRQSIDRGDDLEAALLLNRILRVRGRQTNNAESTALSLQIAVCNWRAGLYADALESMQALMAVDQDRVAWQGLMPPASASTQDLQNWFATFTGIAGANPSEWTQPGGDYRRWASRSRGPARLEQAWVSDSLTVQDVLYADRLNPILQSLRNPLLALNDAQGQENSIVIPAATPLRVGDLVIFRAPWGIRAVNAVDGETVWEVARPNGRILDALQKAEELSVEPVSPAVSESPDSETQVALQSNAELQAITIPLIVAPSLREQMVRTNTTAQLAASASTLFVCENASGTASDNQNQMSFRGTQNEQSASNFVRAYDLKSGLFKWEVGGQTQSAAQPKGKGNQLAGFYFLGTPVILGNRVYVLAQSSEGIFLLQIAEPSASDSGVTNPRIVRSQLLTQPQFSASEHPVRKHAGLVPSYAHGLLICPTCDERIVAVSADDNAVRWVFRYAGLIRRQELGGDFPVLSGSRDIRDSGRVDLDARWTDSLPRIVGDKVLVTPRDSDKLYCLDLRSGKERWEMDRGQFHSIAAIIDDSLILCGNSVVQAFQVDDGKPLWSQSITTGIVCGRPAADQHLLHIPTSEPAIVTIDMQTGRRLASRYLLVDEQEQSEFGDVRAPGNLLIIDNQVLSQDLESLRAYTQGIEELPPVDLATERLLQGDRPGAIALLEKGMDDSSNRSAARNVLIDVLMESLREDFAANQALVGRIRELIQQAEEARPLASVLHLMLGMSLQDIALLPDQLHSRSQRQLSELTRLVAQGLSASQTISLQDLAERMRVMLPEMISGQKEDIAIGQLRHLKSLTFASGIRNALNQRSQQDRIELQNQLREACISALTKTSDRNSQLQFARDVASSGMPQLALHVLQFIIAGKNDAAGELIQQQIQLDVMRAGSDDGTSAKSLLDHCEAMDDLSMIQAIHTEILNPDIANPFNDQRIVTAAAMANRTAFEEWFSEHADSVATEASGWGLTAEIAKSDHRTVMPPQTLPHDIPNVAIPLFGSPGKFRGWSFVVLWKEQKVAAYDIDGRIRWTLPVSGAGEELGDRRRSETYLTASGNLLLLNLNGGIFSLDTSQLTQRTEGDEQVLEPKVLWMRQLADPDADEYRSYSEAEERIIQFAPQLSGYYPVAPLTPLAVALVAGRRLLVYDTLAGHLMWQLDEIPRDTVLLTTREAVLILSEDSRQIESRSLLDGTLLQVSGLPEWWGDANSNAGSSVADDDIEPGEEKLWRIAVLGQSCVLFRLGASKSSLECRDLTTDALTWSVDLPAHSVFSNVANDVVATLSDEHELKLIRIDTGHVLASLDVAPVPKPRDLFLMQSLGNFIVLPEGVDDPSIDLDPVIDAMHVYGRIYCVDGQSMKLRWDEPIDHRYIRLASAQKRVILPNSPILVLLNRGGPADPATGIRRVRHGVKLIDVRTGKELFNQNDVGMGLNDFWLRIDGQKHQLELSFESHILKLDFSDEQLDEKP